MVEMRCLVTGATGYVGGRLVPRLLARGYDVRAMARTPDKLAGVPWRDAVEVVRGDLGDPESLTAAFDGVDVVYYLVHSMGTSEDFAAEERRSAMNVVAAARRAGVGRLVYLGGLHPSGARLSPHLQSRTAVGDILLSSGIETVVLQAGVIIGSGSASFEMIRHLTDRLPAMTTPKWVHNRIQPIAIRDVLHYLVEAASAEVPWSRTWDIGGPDVLEYGEMMQIYAEEAGLRRRLIVVLPFLTPTIASWWVGLVTPIPSGLARPLVESLHCDAVMGDHDIDSVIPPPAGGLTGYREAVGLALERIARGQVETSWANASPQGAPSGPLPSDPEWAGEIAYTINRSAWTPATPEELWKVIDASPVQARSRVETREPGQLLLLLRQTRAPGREWLEMRVRRVDGRGSRYDQRAIFYPRGIAGRLYWYGGLPLHRRRFRATFADVVAGSSGR
ncbi:SDR family oxidoreductase [Mycobacterium sp.]|uniref:SDR family oxidoreductase n=1 Tax=Mycobacterium sp. TaxID=1785 RepID=UPI002BF473D9|nr:DUF2867 domain-containing protein [Mycobacterium sp.]HME47143.1 DUF2867 domain-containing protein [Mycobacterium sp.]